MNRKFVGLSELKWIYILSHFHCKPIFADMVYILVLYVPIYIYIYIYILISIAKTIKINLDS